MQIILVLETRSTAKTDFIYIKSAFDYYYGTRVAQLTKIFAKNKSELLKQDKIIVEKKKRYDGESIVVIFADYDRENDPLNEQIAKYCSDNNYKLVWMNICVEEVFLGKVIPDKLKTKIATGYLKKKDSLLLANKNLNSDNPLKTHPSSNFLIVFDEFLKRIT